MRTLLIFSATCALLLPTPGAAQGRPAPSIPASEIRPSHLAAARELLDLMGIKEAAMSGVIVALEQQMEVNTALAEYRDVIEEWARSVFASERANREFAMMYAEEFSEPDLRALIAFYRTPVGRRLAASQSRLMMRGAEVGQRLAEAGQADLVARLERRERELRSR
jgi:hypothetical protein